MRDELIKEKPFSYAQHPLALESPLEIPRNDPFAVVDRYSSSVASCKDFPLPIHASKSLFVESEQELNTLPLQESQLKQKQSLIKRLSVANLKFQLSELLSKMKDTILSWKDRIWDFFGWAKPIRKDVSNKQANAAIKKSFVNKQVKVAQKDTIDTSNTSKPLRNDAIEKRRIEEIENTLAAYEAELQKSHQGDVRAMMEMACKMAILVGTLGYRFSKQEIKDYIDHLEIYVQKRVKTYEGNARGHISMWVSKPVQVY